MGGALSVPDDFAHCCIVPVNPNKLLLIHGDGDMEDAIENAIKTLWPDGLKDDDSESIKHTYELVGQPFARDITPGYAVAPQEMCSSFLDSAYEKGWQLILSSDLSLKSEHTTWFFKKVEQDSEPQSNTMACLTLAEINKLRLVNVSEQLRALIQDTIGNCREEKIGSEYELTLPAQPWVCTGFEANCRASHMVLTILRQMSSEGYCVYGTANLRDDNDTLFFQKKVSSNDDGTKLALMTLNREGEIRFFGIEATTIADLLEVGNTHWPPGVSLGRINQPYECEELRVSGEPWTRTEENPYGPHWLLAGILQKLRSLGWQLERCMSLSANPDDKSVFLLSSCQPADVPHAILVPHVQKGLALVGGTKAIADVLLARARKTFDDDSITMGNFFYKLTRKSTVSEDAQLPFPKEEDQETCMVHELKLKNIWSTEDQEVEVATRHLMCVLLHEFETNGWKVLASADVTEAALDLDSWFLIPK